MLDSELALWCSGSDGGAFGAVGAGADGGGGDRGESLSVELPNARSIVSSITFFKSVKTGTRGDGDGGWEVWGCRPS